MDETAIAFELPHVRAAATSTLPAPDRISVRDYTRDVEIGAFSSERGRRQRVRFNVVLEVVHSAAAEDDDVDKVISYDTITEAIDAELAHERINLLETLAERVARRCLADPRAARAFVRVEKLDRIPGGALGVEIARTRADGLPQVRPTARPEAVPVVAPVVIFLPNKVLTGPKGNAWLDAVARMPRPAVLAVEAAEPQAPAAGEAALRVGLLAVEQSAWRVVERDARFGVAASRTEIDWALRAGQPVVWAPTKLLLDAVERPGVDASDPLGLAVWLGREIGAQALLAVGAVEDAEGVRAVDADAPEALGELEL